MVYDNTIYRRTQSEITVGGPAGFALHDTAPAGGDPVDGYRYELYSDDGRGNGDFICGSNDLEWMRRVAHSLDFVGNWPTPPSFKDFTATHA